MVTPADAPQSREELLEPGFMSRLEQLEILSRKIFASRQKGERRSRRKGQSVEFADYRNYVIGDDLRFVDWNIYARLERLFLKLFMEEEDLNVSLLIDVSRSMRFGEPDKSLYSRRVAAAMAYIGLCNLDRVNLYAYSDRIVQERAGLRGRRMMQRVVQFLCEAPCAGTSALGPAARQFAIRHTQKGIVVLVSDFFDKTGFEEGMKYLIGRNMDIYVVQVLSPQEVNPPLAGDLRLVDVEDADAAEITVSRPLLDRYKANLHAYCTSLRDYCVRRGANYLLATTDVPFDHLVLDYFHRRGLLR